MISRVRGMYSVHRYWHHLNHSRSGPTAVGLSGVAKEKRHCVSQQETTLTTPPFFLATSPGAGRACPSSRSVPSRVRCNISLVCLGFRQIGQDPDNQYAKDFTMARKRFHLVATQVHTYVSVPCFAWHSSGRKSLSILLVSTLLRYTVQPMPAVDFVFCRCRWFFFSFM